MTPDEIKLHLETLYSYALPRITNQIDLDEVLTDTFAKALASDTLSGVSGEHDSAWLIGILRKQIFEHYRNKYRSEKAVANTRKSVKEILARPFGIPEKLSGLNANILSQSDNPLFWDAFNECIGMLNEVHAEVFILRDLEDVSVEEVCGVFGLNRSDVLELIYRARMMVIACLARMLES